MKPALVGKVFFVKEGHLFPVTPLVESIPRNFSFSRKKSNEKKRPQVASKAKKSKK